MAFINYVERYLSASVAQNYTFSGTVDFGADPGGTSYIAIGAAIVDISNGARTISSIDIDGGGGTIRASGANLGVATAIANLQVSSWGSGKSVTVNGSAAGSDGCGIGVYQIVNPSSAVPSDTGSDSVNGTPAADDLDLSLVIPDGGLAIGVAASRAGGTDETTTWTGLSEHYDEVITGGGQDDFHTGASGGTPNGGSDTAIQADPDGGSSQTKAGCTASWAPAAVAGQPAWKRQGGVAFMRAGMPNQANGVRFW